MLRLSTNKIRTWHKLNNRQECAMVVQHMTQSAVLLSTHDLDQRFIGYGNCTRLPQRGVFVV